MGIFDALLGLHSTKGLKNATKDANAAINNTQTGNAGILQNAADAATGSLTNGTNSALGSLLSTYGGANDAVVGSSNDARAALANGVNSAVGTVQGSNANYQPYLQTGQRANTLFADALGFNGPEGNARATSAFTASPGYQWSVDQATDAAARKAASLGMAGSGNTLDAITRLASNLADQTHDSWLDRLNGVSGQGLTAANGVSSNNQAAGGYQYAGGVGGSGIFERMGSLISGNDKALGTSQATLQSGLGTGLANLQTGLGNSLTDNAWRGTAGTTTNTLNLGAAKDAATNYNNGIFSSLFAKGLEGLGNTASGGAIKSIFAKL